MNVFKLLFFVSSSGLLLCMENCLEKHSDLDILNQSRVCKLDALPDDILINILDNNMDYAEVSRACKLFNKLIKLVYKKRWNFFRALQRDKVITRIKSVELPDLENPSYKDFRDLYKILSAQLGIWESNKPEGVDVLDLESLLSADKYSLSLLVAVLPHFSFFINEQSPGAISYTVSDDEALELVLDWLNNIGNLLAMNKALLFISNQPDRINVRVCANFLLARGADPNHIDTGNWRTALISAAAFSDTALTRVLLQAGADPDLTNEVGDTPLMRASDVEVVKKLLENGANVNAANEDNFTALRNAALRGYSDVVGLLLAAGADTAIVDMFGKTPIMLAVSWGYGDIVNMLLKAGASVSGVDRYGRTPLMLSAQDGYVDIVKILLRAGANINTVGEWGDTALTCAASKQHVKMVKFLLKNGAKIPKHLSEYSSYMQHLFRLERRKRRLIAIQSNNIARLSLPIFVVFRYPLYSL